MYWSRLGRNFYVANTYLPSSYSKLGMNILLRTRSVATDLVTSQKFQPIRCAFMLCQFGRTQNVYVATRISLLSSTAESSATSGYVVAPERSGQSEASAGRNVEWTEKSLVLFPTVDLFDAVCNHMWSWTFRSVIAVLIHVFHLLFDVLLLISSYWKPV